MTTICSRVVILWNFHPAFPVLSRLRTRSRLGDGLRGCARGRARRAAHRGAPFVWHRLGILCRHQAKPGVVDGAEGREEDEQEDGAGEDVQEAVPDELARRGDVVRALADRPRDRVKEQEEREVRGTGPVPPAHRAADRKRASGGVDEKGIPVRGEGVSGCFGLGDGVQTTDQT